MAEIETFICNLCGNLCPYYEKTEEGLCSSCEIAQQRANCEHNFPNDTFLGIEDDGEVVFECNSCHETYCREGI